MSAPSPQRDRCWADRHAARRLDAIVVIGGLISSTLLTLVVLPALYRWFDEAPMIEED